MAYIVRLLSVVTLLCVGMIAFSACSVHHTPKGSYVEYTVSGRSLSVVSAATPYDANQKVRNSFLHWFQQGFETALSGQAPLMIEWQQTPEGEAGQKGYDRGLDEGEGYMKDPKSSDQSQQTIRTSLKNLL